MNIDDFLHFSTEEELFLTKKSSCLKEDIIELLPEEENSFSLKPPHHLAAEREELMSYLDCLDFPISGCTHQSSNGDAGRGFSMPMRSKVDSFQKPVSAGKQKKAKKVENSPFHNYQKHLNNALKKLVIVPNVCTDDEEFKIAARDIWKAYVEGEIKTKKILHFVFNERNEHAINEGELRAYGLWEIYQLYDKSVIGQAKNYLSRLSVDQIDEENIDNYIKSRKMKKTEGFKDYILNFKKELQSGFIKRRVHFQ